MPAAPPSLTQADLFGLWNELADYQVVETDALLTHFYRAMLPLLGADDGFWAVLVRLGQGKLAVRDLCRG